MILSKLYTIKKFFKYLFTIFSLSVYYDYVIANYLRYFAKVIEYLLILFY